MIKTVIVNKEVYSEYRALVREAYDEIFVPTFSRNEMDDYRTLESALLKRRAVMTLVCENLDHPEKRRIHAAALAYYYVEQNIGFLAYNAKRKGCGIRDLGKEMVSARILALQDLAAQRGKALESIIFEVHDPRRMTPEEVANDVMPPEKRISNFKSIGAKELPIDIKYVQPPLREDGERSFKLMLMYYPLNGAEAGPKQVRGFLTGIYKASYGGKGITDEHYWHSIRLVKEWEKSIRPANANTSCEKYPKSGPGINPA